MLDDIGDPHVEFRRMNKRIDRLTVAGGGGDSEHPGTGWMSLQLGPEADATGDESVALGRRSDALDSEAVAIGLQSSAGYHGTAVGTQSDASGDSSVAVGEATAGASGSTALGANTFIATGHNRSTALGENAETTAANQLMLGTASDTVVVPGTFSNPSARSMKQNIEPAPVMESVFPALYEWEYIKRPGRRRIGPMADDLVGTDAERFLVRDDDGEPAGIDKIGLHTAQIAALLARLERLEDELRGHNG